MSETEDLDGTAEYTTQSLLFNAVFVSGKKILHNKK